MKKKIVLILLVVMLASMVTGYAATFLGGYHRCPVCDSRNIWFGSKPDRQYQGRTWSHMECDNGHNFWLRQD